MKRIIILFLALFLVSGVAHALPPVIVTVTEADGAPAVEIDKIKFPNGSVTDNGDGSVSVSTGAIIDDTKGNGDTTYVWSADKVFDQLALKQASDAMLTALSALTTTDGSFIYFTAADTPVVLAACTNGQVIKWNALGRPECTSTLNMSTLDMSAATSSIPQPTAATGSKPGTCTVGMKWMDSTLGVDYTCTATNTWVKVVKGPDSVTANQLTKFSGTTGALTTNSAIVEDGTSVALGALKLTASGVNAAGGSANAVTASGTLGIMDGSDTFRGLFLDYTNANHTGTGNTVALIDIDAISGDANANLYGIRIGALTGTTGAAGEVENAIQIGDGWDAAISVAQSATIPGQISLYELSGNGTNKATIKAADDMANDATITISGTTVTLSGAAASNALNLATTGTVLGAIKVIDMGSTAASYSLAAADAYGSLLLQTHGDAATDVTLPDYQATADVDHVKIGASVCVLTLTAYATLIHPSGDDKIRTNNGTLNAAGGGVTGPATVGAFSCYILTDSASDVGHWTQMGINGAWAAH